jgi:hypothetical protein
MSPRTIERYLAIAGWPTTAGATPSATAGVQVGAREATRTAAGRAFLDCLGMTEIEPPSAAMQFERCVALVADDGYATYLEGALASLDRFGCIPDVPRVVFVAGRSPRCEQAASRHRAHVVRCRVVSHPGPWLKGALYSMARVVHARQYLCLDADILVASSLAPLFAMHAALDASKFLIAAEATTTPVPDLRRALSAVYMAMPSEVDRLLHAHPQAGAEDNVVNDGVFVADGHGLTSVDATLRRATAVRQWVRSRHDVWWRTKAALNIALAETNAIVPLDGEYNAQLHVEPARAPHGGALHRAEWRGRAARVLHFNGSGKKSYASWRRALAEAE